MTQGRCGSLFHIRMTLSFTTPRRFNRRTGEKKMTTDTLQGKKVAILVTDGFEQVELLQPRKALDEAGANPKEASPAGKKVKGWNHKELGDEVPVDVPLESAKAEEFDALLLPGGVMNPDNLRMNPKAVEFVKQF